MGATPYFVDGEGRRVGKARNGVLVSQWLYHDGLRPAAELDGAGNVVARLIYADGGHGGADAIRAAMTRLGARRLGTVSGAGGGPLEYVVRGATVYRVLTDQLGSPRELIDTATGTVAEQITYDAWGNVLADTHPGLEPLGFAGGLYDADTGLVRFGARDYDPGVGRWTGRDPIGVRGGQENLYRYAGNDPIDHADDSGFQIASPFNPLDPCSPNLQGCFAECEWMNPAPDPLTMAFNWLMGASSVAKAEHTNSVLECKVECEEQALESTKNCKAPPPTPAGCQGYECYACE